MRKFLSFASLSVALAASTLAHATQVTPVTITFNTGTGTETNVTAGGTNVGAFNTWTDNSGVTVYDRKFSDTFTYSTTAGVGGSGAVMTGLGASSGVTPAPSSFNNGTIFIYDQAAGATDAMSLDNFYVYFDGNNADALTIQIWSFSTYVATSGSLSSLGTATLTITCGNGAGQACSSSAGAGWISVASLLAGSPSTLGLADADEFAIKVTTGSGANAVSGIDNISLHIAPEPTSLVLMGTGLIGLAGVVRRRRTV